MFLITISQNLGFLGLSYSSPILVCAMGLMIPTFSFLLSVILRRTRLDWRSSSFQAKVSGTIISIIGAVAVELYKGAYIRTSSVSSSPGKQLQVLAQKALLVFSQNQRTLGCGWHFAGICFFICLSMEHHSGNFWGLVRSRVHNWCMSIKGPYYVPLFKPFGIVFATIFGVSLSANSLHYGSVIGSVVIGMGYFVISCGQIREDEGQQDQQCVDERLESNSERKTQDSVVRKHSKTLSLIDYATTHT
ncbi:nodulin MtN21 /EamA-like transporter family protein [Prunus dulcis]|uniref:Nodulin MtN21 /EamA-like transporter family protein n=1 Tax=Prunus dulcis TaxID=3755 RepID=A0A4Y1QQJ9_PRUDU|nr:nodulin MtN21 /EamA-like transporter family protein [Prunus dulcis]